MTKKEMILEMINGLQYGRTNDFTIANRMLNKFERIKEVYDYYLTTEKTLNDKRFCMNLLIVFNKK